MINRTNSEVLNRLLDHILVNPTNENIRFLASKMKDDLNFAVDFLSLSTIIFVLCPSLFHKLVEQVAAHKMGINE